MPRMEGSVMDERRVRFVIGLQDGKAWPACADILGFRARPGTRSWSVVRTGVGKDSPDRARRSALLADQLQHFTPEMTELVAHLGHDCANKTEVPAFPGDKIIDCS